MGLKLLSNYKRNWKKKFRKSFIITIVVLTIVIISNENNKSRNELNKIIIKDSLNKNAKNWIVVTSVNDPTDQVKNLANINDFQLVIVGDKKTSESWNHKNTIYLSIKNQEYLNYKTFSSTPFNSYTRKNIGYLFAIQNGAKYIYDTDDDNQPLVNLTEYFNLNKYDYGLVIDCNSPRVINPYAHFGQPLIWPRGYPLSEIHKNHYNNYICGKRKTSIVQQGTVNGDPDVDAIFRFVFRHI